MVRPELKSGRVEETVLRELAKGRCAKYYLGDTRLKR